MKKIIFTLLYITTCFEFGKAQELKIDDLQKTVIAGSVDRIDSLLRLKGYRLTGLPKEGDKDTSYLFEKSRDVGNLEMISVYKNINEKGTYVAFSTIDNEAKFYKLKEECEKLREIEKMDEFSKASGTFVRRYCDRFFVYTFQMIEDKEMKELIYDVVVVFHSYPCKSPN